LFFFKRCRQLQCEVRHKRRPKWNKKKPLLLQQQQQYESTRWFNINKQQQASRPQRTRALEENELRAFARVQRHPHDTSAWKLLVDNAIRDLATRTRAPITARRLRQQRFRA
jgi:hypothetical protein